MTTPSWDDDWFREALLLTVPFSVIAQLMTLSRHIFSLPFSFKFNSFFFSLAFWLIRSRHTLPLGTSSNKRDKKGTESQNKYHCPVLGAQPSESKVLHVTSRGLWSLAIKWSFPISDKVSEFLNFLDKHLTFSCLGERHFPDCETLLF